MKKIIRFKKIENSKYNIQNELSFETNKGILKLTPEQALEIAYTLFDSYFFDYQVLIDLEEKIKGR